ncbi:integrase [Providencia rettgeri]|nr:integrase [Providencia rettgeri]MDX7320718.1 integrase [Providencia rettgeri]UPS65043.1 integrase [Providencia rettgeri]
MAKRIRRLFSAAFMFKGRGYDPQARMAHSDAESTKIYTENHVEWVEVPHCEIT